VKWLTIQVRLARDLSLQPASKSPFSETFLAEADRNDVVAHLRANHFWMRSTTTIIGSRASWLEPNYGCARCRAFLVLVALNEMPNQIENYANTLRRALRDPSDFLYPPRGTKCNDKGRIRRPPIESLRTKANTSARSDFATRSPLNATPSGRVHRDEEVIAICCPHESGPVEEPSRL
jgi:hypothetical protein